VILYPSTRFRGELLSAKRLVNLRKPALWGLFVAENTAVAVARAIKNWQVARVTSVDSAPRSSQKELGRGMGAEECWRAPQGNHSPAPIPLPNA
jgi:hypothetical protein